MTIHFKKFGLAILTVAGVSLGSIAAMTAPASAHTVCDDDGDDCWRTHPYYGGDWDRDWHERREWQERREWDARRRWEWENRRYPYGWDRGYPGTSLWFNF